MGNETYYRTKTLEYFRAKGYVAETIERQKVIFKRGQHFPIYLKNDIFGADIMACNDKETILANSVKNKTNISKHKKRFLEFPAGGLRRMVVAWIPREKEPFVVEV
jgi:hypothetical protein